MCSFYFSAAAFKAGKFLNVLSLKLTLSKSGYFETVRIFITNVLCCVRGGILVMCHITNVCIWISLYGRYLKNS